MLQDDDARHERDVDVHLRLVPADGRLRPALDVRRTGLGRNHDRERATTLPLIYRSAEERAARIFDFDPRTVLDQAEAVVLRIGERALEMADRIEDDQLALLNDLHEDRKKVAVAIRCGAKRWLSLGADALRDRARSELERYRWTAAPLLSGDTTRDFIAVTAAAIADRIDEHLQMVGRAGVGPSATKAKTKAKSLSPQALCEGEHMTTAEVAEFARRDRKTVLRARKDGRLKSCGGSGGTAGGGGKYNFDRAAVDRWRATLAEPSTASSVDMTHDHGTMIGAALEQVLGGRRKQNRQRSA